MFKNKILPMLLSIVIAFGLWAYVITFVSSEIEGTFYDIPGICPPVVSTKKKAKSKDE